MKSTKHPRCTRCKRARKDVRRRMDPFAHEIMGQKIYLKICKPCEDAIGGEV